MLPENQPYYRPTRHSQPDAKAPSAALLQLHDLFPAAANATNIIPLLGGGTPNVPEAGMQYLSNWPVSFGDLPSTSALVTSTVCSLYNSDLTAAARSLSRFDWGCMGSTAATSYHQSARWVSRLLSSLHWMTTLTVAPSSPSSLHAPALSSPGAQRYWTTSKCAGSHPSYLATLSTPNILPPPSRPVDSGKSRQRS